MLTDYQADARTLVDHARLEAQNHRFTYDEVRLFYLQSLHCVLIFLSWHRQPIGVEALTQSVCDLALGFGEGSDDNKKKQMSRPFGVALLMAGHDENGPQLYFSDPSGNYLQYKAKAIGAGSEGAQSTLQDKFRDDMSLLEAEDLAFEILKQVRSMLSMSSATCCVLLYLSNTGNSKGAMCICGAYVCVGHGG